MTARTYFTDTGWHRLAVSVDANERAELRKRGFLRRRVDQMPYHMRQAVKQLSPGSYHVYGADNRPIFAPAAIAFSRSSTGGAA